MTQLRAAYRTALLTVGACALTTIFGGCAVGQKPGNGLCTYQHEPTTGAAYWLYLPEDYVKPAPRLVTGRRWPLVVSFHGMKPFDNDSRQIRQWQQEADRYGFIVCAPLLRTADLMYEFPFRRVTPSLQKDEQNVIAILNHLAQTTDIDPNAVLSTSFSSGGYLAHFMANRHPDRFSCVAVFQSNFSPDIVDPSRVPEYRDHKIGVFVTENDFAICRRESKLAAQWYARQGFDVTYAQFSDLGHERTPSLPASFFARTCGAKPKTPPTELAALQIMDVPIELAGSDQLAMRGSAAVTASRSISPVPGGATDSSRSPRVASVAPAYERTPGGNGRTPAPRHYASPPSDPSPADRALPTTPVPSNPSQTRTPERTPAPATPRAETSPIRMRLSSTIGIAPLLISYSAVVPGTLRRGAYFLWTDNNQAIANGINGQTYLTKPGEHHIEVVMTAADGREHRASQTVTVLEPITRSQDN
ncbi:MAG: hypothetical protein JXB13_17880 [Phycisphaerae bacterium]|nr:hypothetical protein [Phycisphaerae bacterium]